MLAVTRIASSRSFFSRRAFMPALMERTLHLPMLPLSALPLGLIERLAQGHIALLLRRPVAAAGDSAIDHEIVPIDEARLVAGEEHRRMRDVFGQTGAGDRLRALVDLAHDGWGFLGRFNRQPQRLAEDAGSDCAR